MPPTDTESVQTCQRPNPKNNPAMFQIFQNVQFNVVQHKKYVKEMTKLYKKLDQDAFRESFSNALRYLFTFGDTSANVDRVIQFVATFCTSLDDEEEFLLFTFDVIFNCQCVSGQSVRYRASQLLAAVLAALGDDASLDDDLCDKLLASQMERLQDTRGAVRCRAALALARLQIPMDNDDEVTRAYRFHMSCDPSSSVRRAIVMSIAKSIRNVPFMMERLCDVDEAVRRAAFLYMSAINVTQLKVRQRVHTLKVGLNERSPRVRRVVEEIVIPGWLSAFQGNIIYLLKAIRLDNSQDAKDSQYVAGKLLESLFKRLQTSELLEWLPTDKTLRLIPAEKLNKETAWYWRHLAEHLQKLDDDETLETVLPDLVVLAGYIRAIVEAPCPSETEDPVGFNTRQYVLSELARLLRVYDAGDPVGRETLQKLIIDVLTGDHGPLNPEVIRAFVAALDMVIPEVSTRLELVSSIISELREPTEPELEQPLPQPECTEIKIQRTRLRVSLNVAMEAQEEAVRDQNYALAAECKAKVENIQRKLEEINVPPPPPPTKVPSVNREKLSDAMTLKKCLMILNSALDTPQIMSITPQLQLIYNELEVDLLRNSEILETALETMALYAMLDKDFAKENKAFFFAHIINTDNESLVDTILRCVVDILTVHGVKVFDQEDQDCSTISQGGDDRKRKNRQLYDTAATDHELMSDTVLSLTPIHNTIIELLVQIMDGVHTSYRLIIVEGLCRLLMLSHLQSSGIISRLLLLWFNPATEDEDTLRQTIGVFFQTFPVIVEGAQEQIQKATIPTLRALANAPGNSPIAEIDQDAVVRFIVSLTRVNHEMIDSQGALAVTLVSYLMQHVTAAETGLLCRTLSMLAPPRDVATGIDLAHTLRDLCAKLPDRQSCRQLTRYLGSLEAMERASISKISTGATLIEGFVSTDDLTRTSRANSSIPVPIGGRTHVVIDETVEEEADIDETSPSHVAQSTRIFEDADPSDPVTVAKKKSTQKLSVDASSISPPSHTEEPPQNEQQNKEQAKDDLMSEGSDSNGVSPVKRPKVTKKGKNKLSLRKSNPSVAPTKAPSDISAEDTEKQAEDSDRGGVKRTRSQRSLVDLERGQQKQGVPLTARPSLDSSDFGNITLRRSTRGVTSSPSSGSLGSDGGKPLTAKNKKKTQKPVKPKNNSKKQTGKSAKEIKTPRSKGGVQTQRSHSGSLTRLSDASTSRGSNSSMFMDSADETELHTIVYDTEIKQSLLDESSDDEASSPKATTKSGHITIPESPESTEESEQEMVPKPVKTKPKRGGRKK